MTALEDRVRAALREHAESFPIDPGAWEAVRRKAERSPRSGGARRAARMTRARRYAVPLVAAVAVAATALTVTDMAGRTHVPPRGRPGPTAVPTPSGPSASDLRKAPPVSQIVRLKLGSGTSSVWMYFWRGHLRRYPSMGVVLAHDFFELFEGSPPKGGFGGYEAVHGLSATSAVQDAGGEVLMDSARPQRTPPHYWVEYGVAAHGVASVTAVQPGGRRFPGKVATGRGFPYQVWAARYPYGKPTTLVFRDASGRKAGHIYKPLLSRPAPPLTHGVPVFSYRGEGPVCPVPNGTTPTKCHTRGTVFAYMHSGHVEFWSEAGGPFGPDTPINDGPVLSGRWGDYLVFGQLEWFGVARAGVAKVTVRLADGRTVSAATFHPNWGTDDRLFAVRMPQDLYGKGGVMGGPPHGTATAYDSAGHVLAHVPLGMQ
jgi:hypothetical protein